MYSNNLQERVQKFARTLPTNQIDEFFEILRQQDRETMEEVKSIIKQTFKTHE